MLMIWNSPPCFAVKFFLGIFKGWSPPRPPLRYLSGWPNTDSK